MNKKLIAFFAALVMIVQTFIPAFAFELSAGEQMTVTEPTETRDVQTTGTFENLKYSITNGEVTITGHTTNPTGELVIPETIEDCPVTTIGDKAFSECYSLTGVDMPSVKKVNYRAFYSCSLLAEAEMPAVQTIGIEAFYRCQSLESVDLPDIQTIGNQAFYSCSALERVNMPDVQTIELNAFRTCTALTEFVISDDNPNYSADGGILYNKDKSYLICYPSAKDEITLSASVKTIGECAFDCCYALTSINMPNVVTIDVSAFKYCTGLTGMETPKVESIGEYAFENCTALVSADLPKLTALGGWAFHYCYALVNVDMPRLEAIGGSAFDYCLALENVNIPNVQTLGDNAFYRCDALKSIDMPSVQSIGSYVFYQCPSLESVDMPSVQSLAFGAFYQCTALTSVNLVNVQSVGYYAFWGCDSLESAYFYSDTPSEFGQYVFDSCAADFTIYYAKGMQGWTTPTWNGYNAQEFDPYGYCYVTFVDGVTGETIRTIAVKSGLSAFAPDAPEHEGYTFKGWDKDFSNVTEDMTVTALYDKTAADINIPKVDISNVPFELYDGMMVGDCLGFTINGEHFTVDSLVWLEAPATPLTEDKMFKAGRSYYMAATFNADEGYRFTDNTVITINGSEGNVRISMVAANGQLMVSTQYIFCMESQPVYIPIATVHVYDVNTTPKVGEKCGEYLSYTITEDSHYSVEECFWYNVTDGVKLDKDAVFEADKEYSVAFRITAEEGYCFNEDTVLMLNNSAELYALLSVIEDSTTAWIYSIPEKAVEENVISTGDLNGDDKINTADAVFVLKAAAGMLSLDENQSLAGDCNHDGKVNTADAVLILKYAAGMITEF